MDTKLSFTEIQNGLERIFRKHTDISRIYLSIGGKYNEPEVSWGSSAPITTETANSELQMVPMFVREGAPARTLILVWDLFHNPANLEANRQILSKLQIRYRHISYVLINNRCSVESLNSFIPYIIDLAARSQINSHNLMICNYVRFKYNPNKDERQAERCIPQTIQQLLNWPEHAPYRNIFYQWFGYHPTLYNYLYNYSAIENMLYLDNLIEVVSKMVIKYCFRTSPDITVIQDRKVIQILANVYDLREYAATGADSLLPTETLLKTLTNANHLIVHSD